MISLLCIGVDQPDRKHEINKEYISISRTKWY